MTTVTIKIAQPKYYFGLPFVNMIEKLQVMPGVLTIYRTAPLYLKVECRGSKAVRRMIKRLQHEAEVLHLVYFVPERKAKRA